MEIQETRNSDKGADVTICDLVAQLEGVTNLHVPCVTYLDSFSVLVFKALVLCVDLQSEY